ncbi:MAG TPA: dihydroorotate dehydrogenase electron transfer subunit [Nitrosopumilaceae archaeon]|nr:dihydroorotate dehydrogenase electron transfer subunit [Nitrosopumilaceae archaeon]
MQRNPNHHTICKIEKVIDETPTVRTLTFSDDILCNVLPGQFAMVWIPGVNELPMSIMISPENGKAAFTIRKYGQSSTALYNLKVGDFIGVRGPYGNSFTIKKGKLLLIGGGTGLVPLMRLLKFFSQSDDVTIIMGAKTKSEVFFEDYAKRLLENNPHQVIVATEDGSYGQKGLVTDIMEKLCQSTKFDAVYTCGPELMMSKVVLIATSKEMFVEASLERMMKCGVGICGSCCVNELLVCKDGTIFDGKTLLSKSEFGHLHRNKAGILEPY